MTLGPRSAASNDDDSAPLRVLLTGVTGQLGQALLASCPAGVRLIPVSRAELDLADAQACRDQIGRAHV